MQTNTDLFIENTVKALTAILRTKTIGKVKSSTKSNLRL